MRGFKEENDRECCGTCAYHQHEDIDDGWVCVNPASEFCAEWTEYKDHCVQYEKNKSKGR